MSETDWYGQIPEGKVTSNIRDTDDKWWADNRLVFLHVVSGNEGWPEVYPWHQVDSKTWVTMPSERVNGIPRYLPWMVVFQEGKLYIKDARGSFLSKKKLKSLKSVSPHLLGELYEHLLFP